MAQDVLGPVSVVLRCTGLPQGFRKPLRDEFKYSFWILLGIRMIVNADRDTSCVPRDDLERIYEILVREATVQPLYLGI